MPPPPPSSPRGLALCALLPLLLSPRDARASSAIAPSARVPPLAGAPRPSSLPPAAGELLSSSAAAAAASCNLTAVNTFGFDWTTRVKEYPDGLAVNLTQCQVVCCALSDCVGYAWRDGGSGPASDICWPVASYTKLDPNSDPAYWIGVPPLPPQPSPGPPQPTPATWLPRIAAADMLYSPQDEMLPSTSLPMVGNGMLATQIMSDSIWVSGLYNGHLDTVSHRARIPATNAVPAPGLESAAALDVREATYFRRSWLDPAAPGACTAASKTSCSNAATRIFIEQRWFAHRALPSVLVMEVQILPGGNGADKGVGADAGADAPPFAMLLLANEPGAPSGDISFVPVPPSVPGNAPYTIVNGSTMIPEASYSPLLAACVLTSVFPPSGMLAVPAGEPYATAFFITVIRTTVETPAAELVDAAEADYAAAAALAADGKLRSSHIAEWAETVWAPAGFETDRFDTARAVNSSLYAIVSSFRVDRPWSSAPGGLTNGYDGHSFWGTFCPAARQPTTPL